MVDRMTIDFDGIGGIKPKRSTFGDVLRIWGDIFQIEHLPEDILSSGRVIKAKTLLHFKTMKTMVSFSTIDPLQPDTVVGMVGAETGCRLRTSKGLYVGMTKARARAIAAWFYRINRESSRDFVLYLDPLDGQAGTELGVYFEDGRVDFIGVYRKTEKSSFA